MSVATKLYACLPTSAQHCAVSLYGLYWYWHRFGPGYRQYVREYTQRDQWSHAQWRDWQSLAVRQLLDSTARNVPYYRTTWTSSERQAAEQGRLQDLPLLDKQSLRDAPHAFVRSDVHPMFRSTHLTSGSTGTPIATIWTTAEMRRAIALREARSARWGGVSFTHPRATFSGRMVEPHPESLGPFYRFNAIERQVYLSAFHLRAETAASYLVALRRHKVAWLTGYAVSFYLLAAYILERGLEDQVSDSLKAVITTSEKLTTEMRQVMEKAYRCPVFEEYSTVENTLFASECEHGRLHLSPDAGLVEILRPNGTSCEPNEPGEVVATGILRQYQPLIRFRLGDIACWDDRPCPCGRAMPVIKEVIGRVEDVITGVDGRQLVRFHGVFTGQPHVREGQIIQESHSSIRVKVVVTPHFGPKDVHDLANRVKDRLGSEVEVTVEQVDMIPRSSSGKFQAVISTLQRSAHRDGVTPL